jgi:hypothetical protein
VGANRFPAEQARIMRLLIERIDGAFDDVSVTLCAARIRSGRWQATCWSSRTQAGEPSTMMGATIHRPGTGPEVETLTLHPNAL